MEQNSESVKNDKQISKDDVAIEEAKRASVSNDNNSKINEDEIPVKKRKTRRGKCKRRNLHPYKNDNKANKLIKPEAPYNSNRFLIEDHGNIEELDERLKNVDQISNSTVTRTRDSSFSVDSDGEFYSTPDDEEEFLIKDFDDQYESLQAERFQNMSKNELVQEYLSLENKMEVLTKRMRLKSESLDDELSNEKVCFIPEHQQEISRLIEENEALKSEVDFLRSKLSNNCSSDSEDSETDSSDSCSGSSSSVSVSESPSPTVDYSQTNGHSPNLQTV